jgi:undecaprenyl phosphate N,N'-diacetylbacillosamine 1-phosphate transferase
LKNQPPLYTSLIKPLFDFISALILLVILSPIFLLCILLLALANKGKVFFTQTRPGHREKLFRVIKFKTMTDEKDAHGHLLSDEKRLTRIGKFIRKTSLDEMPQLINVLKGDMSFVGPRPLLVEYLELYSPEQRKRHSVKPGITGWAQVNGRNAISWEQKFSYDRWYVDHISFFLDLKILFMTAGKVLSAKGISSETSATMERFTGNQRR